MLFWFNPTKRCTGIIILWLKIFNLTWINPYYKILNTIPPFISQGDKKQFAKYK